MREKTTAISRGVEVIERVPVILTAQYGLAQGHVEVLIRSERIASMPLPRLVAEHSLPSTSGLLIKKLQCNHINLPVEIVGCSGVVEIEVLLLAIIVLQ